jgi:LacI family transcriptional regulator
LSTIREVSRRANVSMSTVSRVLNGTAPVAEATRQRVLEAVDELGYTPNAFAQGLVTNRSGGVGVVVNALTSAFFGLILRGIETAVEEAGMHMMVASGHADPERERAAADFLRQRRSDALIIQFDGTPDLELIELARGELPTVVLGRYVAELADRCVYLDNEMGGAMATRHLIERGHRRIAHIAGPLSVPDARSRLQGYRQALEGAGLPYDEDLVIESDFMVDGGHASTERLLERDLDITALFAANDEMAAGAIVALGEAGYRLPDDISIVGFDDVVLARHLHPALTTVKQPLREMGRAAAQIALAAIEGREVEVQRRFEPELVERTSVKTLP